MILERRSRSLVAQVSRHSVLKDFYQSTEGLLVQYIYDLESNTLNLFDEQTRAILSENRRI